MALSFLYINISFKGLFPKACKCYKVTRTHLFLAATSSTIAEILVALAAIAEPIIVIKTVPYAAMNSLL
jgi:hypothetical protein